MIDLQPFCANEWEIRDFLQQPFRDGAWVYATNGHMVVRVPAADAPDAEERSKAQPKNLPDLFRKWLDDQPGEFLLMPPLFADTACLTCCGSGTWPDDFGDKEGCWSCHGSGYRGESFALGDANFNVHYLHLLAALPQCRIRTQGPKQAAAVIFDGGQALLMPVHMLPGA